VRSTFTLAVGLALAPSARASTFTVTQAADLHISGLSSLRAAIDSLNDGAALVDERSHVSLSAHGSFLVSSFPRKRESMLLSAIQVQWITGYAVVKRFPLDQLRC